MVITIQTIPHAEHRYSTVGDWLFDEHDGLWVAVSRMSDARYEWLVAVHEVIEALLCRHAGITQEAVDAFDMAWVPQQPAGQDAHQEGSPEASEAITEPGDDPRAPYHAQHLAATELEMRLAHLLGVDWSVYCREVESL
jgi:hypothetical protein